MRLSASLAAFLAVVLLVAPPGSAAPSTPQSKQRAERNLLNATLLLERWHVGLVNPKSGLLLQNTTAACTGKGRRLSGGYTRFVCVLRRRTLVVRVLYVALSHSHFEAHRLR